MFDDLPRPIVFAHRGASAEAPENTLAAFELALRQGCDAIELDVRLSKDNQVVVIHDPTVDRTTDGQGVVKDLSLGEIRKLDAGSHFDVAFQGETIPTLDEVFKAIGQLTYINVELANYNSMTDELPEKVAQLVRKHKLARRVLFSSFNPICLLRIRRLVPEAPAGLLAHPGKKGRLARSRIGELIGYQSLHVNFNDVTLRLLNHQHKKGYLVFSYTVNSEEYLRQQIDLGVDGIFTDEPRLARQILGQTSHSKSRI
jgi:glycerophosphoryl diester phosphodiesterase